MILLHRRALLCSIAAIELFLCVPEYHCTGGKSEASRDGNPPHGLGKEPQSQL